jgi:hypothetical protein
MKRKVFAPAYVTEPSKLQHAPHKYHHLAKMTSLCGAMLGRQDGRESTTQPLQAGFYSSLWIQWK